MFLKKRFRVSVRCCMWFYACLHVYAYLTVMAENNVLNVLKSITYSNLEVTEIF